MEVIVRRSQNFIWSTCISSLTIHIFEPSYIFPATTAQASRAILSCIPSSLLAVNEKSVTCVAANGVPRVSKPKDQDVKV